MKCGDQFRIHEWVGFILGFQYVIWTSVNNEEWKAFLDGNQTGRQGCLNNTEDLHDQISGWLTLEFPLSTNDSISGQRFRLIGK